MYFYINYKVFRDVLSIVKFFYEFLFLSYEDEKSISYRREELDLDSDIL